MHLRVPLYRNAYGLTVGAIAASGLGTLYWLFAARIYAPEVLGLASAVVATVLFLAGVGQLCLDGMLVRFLPPASGASRLLVRYAYVVCGLTTTVISLVFLIGLPIWAPALGFLTETFWAAAGFVVATSVTSLLVLQDGALTGLGAVGVVAVKNTFAVGARVALVLLLARPLPDFGLLVSWLVPSIGLFAPTHIAIARRLDSQERRGNGPGQGPTTGALARFVANNYLGHLLSIAMTMLPPLLVVQLLGTRAGAYFYPPWMIATTLRLLPLSMGTSLTVEGARDGTNAGAYTRQALRHTVRLMAPAVAVLAIGAEPVLALFGSNYAEEGATLLRLLVLGTLPHIVCVLFISLARLQERTHRIVLVQGGLAVLLFGLSSLWLPTHGIVGVGMGWLESQSIVAAVLLPSLLRPVLHASGSKESSHGR